MLTHSTPTPTPTMDSPNSVETLARQNCISILLARQSSHPKPAVPSSRRRSTPRAPYTCKSCHRTFDTFQALGGHRAGHTRISFSALDYSPCSRSGTHSKVHECTECQLTFATGQALGGHMRSHIVFTAKRKRVAGGDSVLQGEETKEEIETAPFLHRSLLIDLNFPPVDQETA